LTDNINDFFANYVLPPDLYFFCNIRNYHKPTCLNFSHQMNSKHQKPCKIQHYVWLPPKLTHILLP